jgi:hypothetical protein
LLSIWCGYPLSTAVARCLNWLFVTIFRFHDATISEIAPTSQVKSLDLSAGVQKKKSVRVQKEKLYSE